MNSSSKAGGPPGEFVKKPKLSKAEQCAQQTAQRAAKAAKAAEASPVLGGGSKAEVARKKKVSATLTKSLRVAKGGGVVSGNNKVLEMFSHLPSPESRHFSTHEVLLSAACGLHPLVVTLGVKIFEKRIVGSHARCMAMLRTLDVVIQDHITVRGKEFSRDIFQKINTTIIFLAKCRPLCDSMSNAIKALKQKLTELDPSQPEAKLKNVLTNWIETFRCTRLTLAQQSIADMVSKEGKIQDGDVVLTNATTTGLMTAIITKAYNDGKKFRVIVVGSKALVSISQNAVVTECTRLGIKCSYTMINAVSYIMREVTKVFLSVHALLGNGYVMGKVGTALIAMTAKAHKVPVLVPCETYKFSERVQTDSFVFNELGDPNDFVKDLNDDEMTDWRDIDHLTLINMVYDVTPPEFVDMVITEIGMIPCSSVPVVLRVTQANVMD